MSVSRRWFGLDDRSFIEFSDDDDDYYEGGMRYDFDYDYFSDEDYDYSSDDGYLDAVDIRTLGLTTDNRYYVIAKQ